MSATSCAAGDFGLAAFDVDGTLLDSFGVFPQVSELMSVLAAEGVDLALCSARPFPSLSSLADKVGFTPRYISALQGAEVYVRQASGWERIAQSSLSLARGRHVLTWCERLAHEAWWYNDRHWFVRSISEEVRREIHSVGMSPTVWTSTSDLVPPSKILMLLDDNALRIALAELSAPDLSISRSHSTFVEVVSTKAGVQKGLDVIMRHSGLDVNRTVAIGDGPNDAGMLASAGRAFRFPSPDWSAHLRNVVALAPPREGGFEQLATHLQGILEAWRHD